MFWKQYKEYIVVIILFAIGVVIVWFGVIPLQNRVRTAMDTVQSLEVDRDMQEASVAELDAVRAHKKLIQDQAHRLNIVINKSDIVNLIKDIESLAKETDNAIQINAKELPPVAKAKPKPEATSEAKDVNKKSAEDKPKEEKVVEKKLLELLPSEHKVLISLKVTGTYENILHFLQKIETMPFATDVTALTLAVAEKKPDSQEQSRSDIFSIDDNNVEKKQVKTIKTNPSDLSLVATFETVVYVNE